MSHILSCELNTRIGGDHAYCECPCHKSKPAIPPSRRRIVPVTGYRIKNMLMEMRLVLGNSINQFETDYFISQRGVPCVWVIVGGERYQFTFFGRSQKFRVFLPDGSRKDIELRNDVINYFIQLKGDCDGKGN